MELFLKLSLGCRLIQNFQRTFKKYFLKYIIVSLLFLLASYSA